MQDRSRFSSVDYSVGWLAALTVVVISLMVLQAGRVQGWLDDWVRFQVRMPDKQTSGLRAGADVQMYGTSVGRVRKVEIDRESIVAVVEVRPEFAKAIRADATVRINRAFVVAGDAFLSIDPGETGPFLQLTEETQIEAVADDEIGKLLQVVERILLDLEEQIPATVNEVERTTRAVAEMTERFAAEDGDLNRIIANARELSDAAADPRGPLQFLLRNIDLTKSLEEALLEFQAIAVDFRELSGEAVVAVREAQPLLAEVNRTVAEARLTLNQFRESGELRSALSSGAEAADALPVLMIQLERTLLEVEKLTRDLQGSWFVGGDPRPNAPAAMPSEGLP